MLPPDRQGRLGFIRMFSTYISAGFVVSRKIPSNCMDSEPLSGSAEPQLGTGAMCLRRAQRRRAASWRWRIWVNALDLLHFST
jgi:hypothetical protein